MEAMYLRVKRQRTTYFVHCNSGDSGGEVKAKLQALSCHPARQQRLILLPSRRILDDSRTLAQQQVESGSILALTLRKGSGDWEDIDIQNSDPYESRD
ncbi:hypothetical protein GOP47_0003803 [Adiantum capillus-veneris]|uniref:Ubiquitin-like domain-containing protein n=1 Tax=Adiantum capillus-veneris TaxID=13818 RepID=A0A9D4ZPS0_ADICA|nr:hypothetical protein GOP47_0003803 [Adiantum capillus-veneris]